MQAETVANKRIGQFGLKKIKTRLRALELRKLILRAQNHRGKFPGAGRRVNVERSRMRRAGH